MWSTSTTLLSTSAIGVKHERNGESFLTFNAKPTGSDAEQLIGQN